MSSFSEYMHKNAYSSDTIPGYDRCVTKFLNWCKQKQDEVPQLDYKRCLEYFEYIENKKDSAGKKLVNKSVSHQLGTLKLYFNYLVEENIHIYNPLANTNIKNVKRKYSHTLLSKIELEELYESFQTENIKLPSCKSVAIRNKVVTGLAIFQGCDAVALKSLKVEHIDLRKGRVDIPGTKKTNGRTLKLEPCQTFDLVQYLQMDRPILQKRIECYTDALFPMNTNRISCITSPVVKVLRSMNLRVTNLKQIRASVITLWVTEHNLRKAQVMCGHRFISSTEAYLKNDHTEMHDAIGMYHPMQ